MQQICSGLAAFTALAIVAAGVSAHEPAMKEAQQRTMPESARAAEAVVDGFHAALGRGETQAAAAFLADDALIFEGGGAERSKAEYAAQHLAADAEFSKAIPSVVTRRTGFSSGAMAWIATEAKAAGNFKGKAIDSLTAETMVVRRIGPEWKIVHIHWSAAKR